MSISGVVVPIVLVLGVYAKLFRVTRKRLKSKKALTAKKAKQMLKKNQSELEESTAGVYLGPVRQENISLPTYILVMDMNL